MNDRWSVIQGRWGGWLVWRGPKVMAAFNTWDAAYRHARQEAVHENLGVISIEICS